MCLCLYSQHGEVGQKNPRLSHLIRLSSHVHGGSQALYSVSLSTCHYPRGKKNGVSVPTLQSPEAPRRVPRTKPPSFVPRLSLRPPHHHGQTESLLNGAGGVIDAMF